MLEDRTLVIYLLFSSALAILIYKLIYNMYCRMNTGPGAFTQTGITQIHTYVLHVYTKENYF